MLKRISFAPLLLYLLVSRCLAIDPSYFSTVEGTASKGSSSVISFGYIIQLIFSLLVVFGFIYLAAKYILPRFQSGTKSSLIEIADRLTLEPQVTAYIIRAGGSSWLVIVSGKTVQKIDKIGEGI